MIPQWGILHNYRSNKKLYSYKRLIITLVKEMRKNIKKIICSYKQTKKIKKGI